LGGLTAAVVVGLVLITESQFVWAAEALSIADFAGHFRGEAQVQAGDRFLSSSCATPTSTYVPEPMASG